MSKRKTSQGIFALFGGLICLSAGCHSDPALSPAENKQAQQEFTRGGVDMNKVPPEQKAKVQEMIKKYGGGASRTASAPAGTH